MPLVVEPLASGHLDKWQNLFERAASGCHCRFWHFEGDKNAWLLRIATEPEVNAAEAASAVRADDGTARGLVALDRDTDRIVGWLKVAPRSVMPKLLKLNAYRERTAARDAHSEGSGTASAAPYVVGCFLVDPEARRQGVARALLAAAPKYAKSLGATQLEAYPRRSDHVLHDEQAFLGPERLYLAAGFTAFADPAAVSDAYPVYILPL